jgi:Protein of unknown function (DUF4199)
MQNHFVKYGFVMGLASIIFSLILYFADPTLLVTWGSWVGIFIALYCMVKSVNDTKTENGGFLSLSDAFKAGWLVYVLGSFISSMFMFVLINYIDPTLIETIRALHVEAFQKVGQTLNMSPEQIETQISVIKETNPYGLAQLAISIPTAFLFPGAILAIIIATILKKNNRNPTLA